MELIKQRSKPIEGQNPSVSWSKYLAVRGCIFQEEDDLAVESDRAVDSFISLLIDRTRLLIGGGGRSIAMNDGDPHRIGRSYLYKIDERLMENRRSVQNYYLVIPRWPHSSTTTTNSECLSGGGGIAFHQTFFFFFLQDSGIDRPP